MKNIFFFDIFCAKRNIAILVFVIFLAPAAAQNVFADTMTIDKDASVTVGAGSSITIDSQDSPNTLTNKGTLTIEDTGQVIITNEGNFFNDCSAFAILDAGSTMQIGSLGALLSSLTNHGTVSGLGQINFIADSILAQNSGILFAVLNPFTTIIQIASICPPGGSNIATAINSGSWNDPNVWESGIVPGVSDNKKILSGLVVTVPAGQTVDNDAIIDNTGGFLEVRGILNNQGVIQNNLDGTIGIAPTGTLENQVSGLIENIDGTLGNSGTINNNLGAIIDNKDFVQIGAGALNNLGLIENKGGFLEIGALLDNSGTIKNTLGGTVGMTPTGTLENQVSGLIENIDGTLGNSGTINNNLGAIIDNKDFVQIGAGALNNLGLIENKGGFLEIGALLDNSGTIKNTLGGTVGTTPTGTLENNAFGVIENTDGTLGNSGTINNNLGAIIDNKDFVQIGAGALNNLGLIENKGGFLEIGALLDNSGTIKNTLGGTVGTTPTGTLENNAFGVIENTDGTLGNSGIIKNDCNASITGNQGIGNLVILPCRPDVTDDFGLGGTTTATVIAEGDQTLTISDEPNPEGLRITTGPGVGAPAQISVCGGAAEAFFPGASEVRGTCGSVTWTVISGQIQTTLTADEGSTADATLDAGDSLTFDDETFTMETTAGTAEVIVTADDGTTSEVTLDEGNAITVDPETSIISADPDNPTDVTVLVDGEETTIPPGETALPSAEQAIQNLIDVTTIIELPKGLENSLLVKLGDIPELINDINTNNDVAACGKLGAYVNEVDALEDKKLTIEEAALLRGLAEDIKSAIGC